MLAGAVGLDARANENPERLIRLGKGGCVEVK